MNEYASNIDWTFLESLNRDYDATDDQPIKPTATADDPDPDLEGVLSVPYAHPKIDERINDAFKQLKLERERLHDAEATTALRREAYDDCKRDMIIGGHVTGKNAEERDAKLSDLLRVQIAQLRQAETAERAARLYFDIARDEVKRMELLTALMTRP